MYMNDDILQREIALEREAEYGRQLAASAKKCKRFSKSLMPPKMNTDYSNGLLWGSKHAEPIKALFEEKGTLTAKEIQGLLEVKMSFAGLSNLIRKFMSNGHLVKLPYKKGNSFVFKLPDSGETAVKSMPTSQFWPAIQ